MDELHIEQSRLVLRILPLIRKYPHFCLKGGTALNFFVHNLPRLSVDIDLTYIPINNRNDALTEITSAMESLKTDIERRFGNSRVVERRTRDGHIRGLLINAEGSSIKIEPNHVIRGTVFDAVTRPLSTAAASLFKAELDFPILSIPDLYGGKICAALDRQHPRDLFDILLMKETIGFHGKIKDALLVYILSHPRPISELIDPNRLDIREMYEKEFMNMTDRSLSLGELESTRENLIREVKSSLTAQDKKFLLSVKTGEPRWELHSCPHIERLPAVQWKVRNI